MDNKEQGKEFQLVKIEKVKSYNIIQILFMFSILVSLFFIMEEMYTLYNNLTITIPIGITIIIGSSFLLKEIRPQTKNIIYFKINENDEEVWKTLFYTFTLVSYDESNNIIAVTPNDQTKDFIEILIKELEN